MDGLPDHDPGELPPDFVDPIENPDLDWIGEADPEDYEHLREAWEQRLAEEPEQVEVDLRIGPDGERLRMLAPCAVPGINLRDYSRNPQSRGAGAPCSIRLATIQLSQARIAVDVRLAELIGLIMKANEAQGYVYRRADTGAYNCRKIAGTSTWSWHAWAWAVDGNWQTNPYTSPLRTDRPEWERARWNRYGFAGGWDYSGRKDAMHTEWMGDVAEIAAALVLARRELLPIINGTAPKPAPAPTPGGGGTKWKPIPLGGVTVLGSSGEQVKRDQRELVRLGFGVGSAGADGFAGDDTITAARAFQAAAGIGVDGKIGSGTRAAFGKVPNFPGSTAYRRFQERLRQRGWQIGVDGKWGPESTRVLTAFQREKGLSADGRPGPITWTALWTRSR